MASKEQGKFLTILILLLAIAIATFYLNYFYLQTNRIKKQRSHLVTEMKALVAAGQKIDLAIEGELEKLKLQQKKEPREKVFTGVYTDLVRIAKLCKLTILQTRLLEKSNGQEEPQPELRSFFEVVIIGDYPHLVKFLQMITTKTSFRVEQLLIQAYSSEQKATLKATLKIFKVQLSGRNL